MRWIVAATLVLAGCASTAPVKIEYRTDNFPQRWNTTGALLFASLGDVKECFSRVYSGRSQGFSPCEPKAMAVLPVDVGLELLEKYDADNVVKVRVLEGERKGLVGYVHELWIKPSPWEPQPVGPTPGRGP